jgi:hypothetical protein
MKGPHVIDPNAVYLLPQINEALGLRESTVRREVREGRLRIAKRAGRYYCLGSWLLEWIAGGELRPRAPAADDLTCAARRP